MKTKILSFVVILIVLTTTACSKNIEKNSIGTTESKNSGDIVQNVDVENYKIDEIETGIIVPEELEVVDVYEMKDSKFRNSVTIVVRNISDKAMSVNHKFNFYDANNNGVDVYLYPFPQLLESWEETAFVFESDGDFEKYGVSFEVNEDKDVFSDLRKVMFSKEVSDDFLTLKGFYHGKYQLNQLQYSIIFFKDDKPVKTQSSFLTVNNSTLAVKKGETAGVIIPLMGVDYDNYEVYYTCSVKADEVTTEMEELKQKVREMPHSTLGEGLEVVKEYEYKDDKGKYYVLILVNNTSGKKLNLDGTGYFINSDGHIIRESNSLISSVNIDIDAITCIEFTSNKEYADFKYEFISSEGSSYISESNNIDVSSKVDNDKLFISALNKTEYIINQAECYVLFYKDGNLVSYSKKWLTQNTKLNLNPNKVGSASIPVAGIEFDSYEIFITDSIKSK